MFDGEKGSGSKMSRRIGGEESISEGKRRIWRPKDGLDGKQ